MKKEFESLREFIRLFGKDIVMEFEIEKSVL